MHRWNGNSLFIGEWSIATTDRAPFTDDVKFKQLSERYVQTMEIPKGGWTYWSWKVSYDLADERNAWSLRRLISDGLFTW